MCMHGYVCMCVYECVCVCVCGGGGGGGGNYNERTYYTQLYTYNAIICLLPPVLTHFFASTYLYLTSAGSRLVRRCWGRGKHY